MRNGSQESVMPDRRAIRPPIRLRTFVHEGRLILRMDWHSARGEALKEVSAPLENGEIAAQPDLAAFAVGTRLAEPLRASGVGDPDGFLDGILESLRNPGREVCL